MQAYIVRNFFDEAGFYPIFLKDDVTLLRAIKILQEGKSVPNAELLKQSANGDLHSQAGPYEKIWPSRKKEYSRITLCELSDKIMDRLEQTELFQAASCIALYHAIPGEVQTAGFIEKWYQKKKLLLPLIVGG